MGIQKITADGLRRMEGKEGLVLQGCGGDLKEWHDGINEELDAEGILKNGAKFEDIYSFEHEGVPCLLFPFEGVDVEVGKLAVWRLRTHGAFGGTWLSDYVPDRLGGFAGELPGEPEKPDCELIGQDGNVFNLVGMASKTLERCGMKAKADEMRDKVFASGSYAKALSIIGEYVNIVAAGEAKKLSVLRRLKEEKPERKSAAREDPGKWQEKPKPEKTKTERRPER